MEFFTTKKQKCVPIKFIPKGKVDEWAKSKPKGLAQKLINSRFKGNKTDVFLYFSNTGELQQVLLGLEDQLSLYQAAYLVERLKSELSAKYLNTCVFELIGVRALDSAKAFYLGWAMACYTFTMKSQKPNVKIPKLYTPNKEALIYAKNLYAGIEVCRDLINLPANKLGPHDLEKAIIDHTKEFKPKVKVYSDQDLLKNRFFMIYAVGKASPDRPRFVTLEWGKKSDPQVALVGKGVTFDTGGLNIKPDRWMDLMKKDMGGAAHALGLSLAIMKAKLPINLKLYIPIVENAIAGNSFRPSDILDSRKGLTVEIIDTDAEGRLIVGDALTYATEQKPELVIDFTTLTGAARVATGYDLPPFFCNNEKVELDMRHVAQKCEDAIWPLPLWEPYLKELDSEIADIRNLGNGGRAGAIHAALFLQEFLMDKKNVDWVHFDLYAWSHFGRPGHPKGGTDQSLRAVYHYLEKRYSKAA